MKVNILLPHFNTSGGISVSLNFAHKLAEKGHRVIVATENRRFLSRFYRNLLGRHPLVPKNSKLKLLMVKEFKNLPDADIFLADSWQTALKLSKIKTQGVKFQYLQHDERMYHGDPEEVAAVFRLPLIKLVNATWLQRMLKKDFNYNADTLFNSVDCELFNPNKRDRSPDDHNIRVLVLHHDYEWKGTKVGVEIVQNLKKKYPNVKLILFGTRQEKIDYSYDEYHYNSFNEDLAKLFANGDIYIGPSLNDSRAILHRWMMASGCAMAIYDNVSSDEYAFDGETALVAKINNIADLSNKVEELIVNPVLRKKIAGKALDFVRQLPTWDEMTDKLENIFEKAISVKHKKILITGAKGFVGSRLLSFLSKRGYDVEGIDEEILDIEKLRPHFKNASFVVHLAAKLHEGQSEKRPHDFFQVNVVGTMNVVKLCIEYGCKLINTSSITTKTEYGISKVLSEEMVRLYTKHRGLQGVTIRPCVIYDENSGRVYPYISKHYPLGKLVEDIENIIIHDNFKKYKVYKIGGLGQKIYFEEIELLKKKIRPIYHFIKNKIKKIKSNDHA